MKETPPVLTAGPAAWIRDRGRKRSRLLGTTQPGRGWAGDPPGPTRAEPRAEPASAISPPRAGESAAVSARSACDLESHLQTRPWCRHWVARPVPRATQPDRRRWHRNLDLPTHELPKGAGGTAEPGTLHYSSLRTQPPTGYSFTKWDYLIPPRLAWGGLRHIWRHPVPGWSQPHPAAPLKLRPSRRPPSLRRWV
jgi:hypothetical protein